MTFDDLRIKYLGARRSGEGGPMSTLTSQVSEVT